MYRIFLFLLSDMEELGSDCWIREWSVKWRNQVANMQRGAPVGVQQSACAI